MKKNKPEETEDEEDTEAEALGVDPLENLGKIVRAIEAWSQLPGNVRMIKKGQALQLKSYLSSAAKEIIRAREDRVILGTRVEERSEMLAETLRAVVREELKAKTTVEVLKEPESFAKAIGRKEVPKMSGAKWPVLPAPKIVVVKQDGKESEEVRKKLKELVKPSELGLKVKRLKMIKNGVLIEAESDEGVQKLMEHEALKKAGINVDKPKKKNPIVMIYDVNAELKDEEVKEEIFKRNLRDCDIMVEEFIAEFSVKHRYEDRSDKKREGKRHHLVVECSVRVRNWLRRKGKVYVEWESCRVKDYVDVARCYKCQRYGHVAKKCTSKNDCCSFCSGEHSYKECRNKGKEEAAKCCNCVRDGREKVNHPPSWRGCPSYLKAVKRYNESIDYGV